MSSGSTLVWYLSAMRLAIFARRDGRPSVVAYCSSWRPSFSTRSWETLAISSTGNSSGAGRPPAKEIISGWAVNFNSSRISEACIRSIRVANFMFKNLSSLETILFYRNIYCSTTIENKQAKYRFRLILSIFMVNYVNLLTVCTEICLF